MKTIYYILIIILIIIFFNYTEINEGIRNTFYFDNDANYQYIMDLDKKPCTTYNCPIDSSTDGHILLVATDSKKNPVFKYNDIFYTLKDNVLVINENSDDLTYTELPTKVPADISKMKLKVNLDFNGYKYVGLLNNNFYNQEYILYEKQYNEDSELENKLYYYNLVKIIDGKYTTMYELPPRAKILPNEYIWASYGSFQIGPLIFN